jgi:hypothetical protein
MATPVSIESPPNGRVHVRTRSEQERDLQAKVQHMISLQQQISNSSFTDDDKHDGTRADDYGYGTRESDTVIVDGGGLTLSKQLNTRTHTNLLGLGDDVENEHAGTKPLHPSSGNVNTDIELSKDHQDVGKGTIVFSANLRGSKYVTGGGSVDGNKGSTQPQRYLQLESLQNNQQHEQYRQQMSPHSTTLGSQQHQNLLQSPLPQQIYYGYGSVQEQNHEFHYGNPDFNNIDEQDDYYYNGDRQRHQRGGRSRKIFARMFACFYQPIAHILSQENLHRSFCYGGIDGLLTGSGIASAFWGLGLLSVRTPFELRIAVVVFTMAACVADSLCMAMGHVWTTYIVTSNHAWERSYERESLEQDKAESKGKLVDMLLARGMLKIDAMSLADTLEGYPDLFVSALVGDSLLSSGIQDALLDEPTESEYQQQQREQQRSPVYSDPATDFDGAGEFLGSFGSWKCAFQYNSERHSHRDLEQSHVKVVYQESQKEGIFMMLGFASFALVPSLLWLILPLWFDTDLTSSIASSSSMPYAGVDDGESVNIPSLIILILSCIVWCLGVWKSRFVDSNWVVFGLETIAVLIVCISSAYGIAALLGYCLGLNDPSNGGMSILDKWNLPTNAPSGLTT